MWTVWVGGSEATDYYLPTVGDAVREATYWESKGYDDVVIEEVTS